MSERDKIWYFLVCVFLAATVVGVYWPVRNHEFIMYDDNVYVSENKQVKEGLTWENVRWAFTHQCSSNWHPLTWFSHMLDVEIYGMRPGGHHFTNVVIHATNTVLLFAVFEYMTGALWASAFIAAMFGLHPLHVESVAWAAERKDVLSTLFMILAMGAYVLYVRRGGIGRYLGVLALFAAGLMAKPMLVTLPFVLLLLDYWPLERARFGKDDLEGGGITAGVVRRSLSYLVKEKIPFFVLSAISSAVTFIVQKSSGAVVPIEQFNLRIRISNAIVSYVGYIWHTLWPLKLAVLYPHPGNNISAAAVLGSMLILVVLTACFVYFGMRRKLLLVGWIWYVGMLVPVIGLVQVGAQAMADRYMYMPMTGLLIIVAWGLWELSGKLGWQKITVGFLAAIVVCVSAGLTARQVRYWRNSMTLFEHTIEISPQAYDVRNNYASLLKDAGRFGEAIKHFKIALAQKPDMAESYYNLGNTLRKMDRLDEAIANYKKAIKFKPDFVEAHYNLGTTLVQAGRLDEAFAAFKKTLELKPDDVEMISGMGLWLAKKGETEKAIEYYKKTIEIDPNYVFAHGKLALALGNQGRFAEALEQCLIVLKHRPDDKEMYCNVAVLLEKKGQFDEALEYYRKSLQVDPNYEKARELLAEAIKKKESRQDVSGK